MSASHLDQRLPSLSFFADSSSKDSEYMVLGGFAVRGDRIAEIDSHIKSLRDSSDIGSEFHWNNYKGGGRRSGYEALVNYAFELVESKRAHLHIIIARFIGFDHRSVGPHPNPGGTKGRDTSVNKMYWQMMVHRVARYYGKSCLIHARLDAGDDCADISHLRNQICAEAWRRYQTKPNCIRSIFAMDSKASGIIQMADVISGAIAAERNRRDQSAHKTALREFVLKRSGRQNWQIDTPRDQRNLTIWNMKT